MSIYSLGFAFQKLYLHSMFVDAGGWMCNAASSIYLQSNGRKWLGSVEFPLLPLAKNSEGMKIRFDCSSALFGLSLVFSGLKL